MAPRVERTADVQPHLTEERYRALAETLRAVPWEGDPETDRITYVGPQIETLAGYTVEEWMATGAWVRAIHPDDRDAQVQKYEWHLQRRRDHNLEYRVLAKSGQQIWVRDIIAFVTNAAGREIVRGLMIVIDEEKALERALRKSELRYRHAERIAKLAHWSHRAQSGRRLGEASAHLLQHRGRLVRAAAKRVDDCQRRLHGAAGAP